VSGDDPVGASVAWYAVDAEDRLVEVGAALSELAGRPAGELVGRPFLELIAPPDRPRVAEARRRASPVVEARLERADGWRWIAARRASAPGEAGVLLDLSGARLEGERDQRRDELARLAAAVGDVVHEVGNPLAAVTTYVQLAQRQGGGVEAADSLGAALDECRRAQTLLRRLASFAGQAEGSAEAPLAATPLVETALLLVRRRLRANRIAWAAEVPADLPPVRAVGAAPVGALLEVLRNAVTALGEAHPDGGPAATLRVTARCDDEALLLDVDDAGAGLEPGARARAPTPFYGQSPGRTGLGLTLARAELESLGGELALDAAPGGGLRVTLRLPFA